MDISSFILAQANPICPDPNKLCNPTHVLSFDTFAKNILVEVGLVIGLLTVVMVVQSAYKMVKARGNEENIAEAKAALQWSVSGLVLIILAFAIVSAVANFFKARDINPNPGQVVSPVADSDLFGLASTLITGFLSVVGILAIFFIIFGAFKYLTARGDEEQISEAKRDIQWAIFGLIVAALAYVIVTAVANFIHS